MKSKILKAFSITSFCCFFAGLLFLFMAVTITGHDALSILLMFLFIFSPFSGITLAVIDLVKSRKNRQKGKKGGIMGLSIAAICLNFFTLIISICFSAALISMAYDRLNYRWTYYIPETDEKYRGFYIPEEYFDPISKKESYLKCFRENHEEMALYEVRERTIACHDETSYESIEISKERAEKFKLMEEKGTQCLEAEYCAFYYKVTDSLDNLGESILKLYVPDADQVLPGYSFVLLPFKETYNVDAANTDFLISRFDEDDPDAVEKIFAVKMNGSTPEIRPLERNRYDEFDEDGCHLYTGTYFERINPVKKQ